ncbi:hypothetical protein ABEB36_006032 [Hypothenemus hampei]|uniref:Uncharacterized protein n=1 Tax=Hypothenemus hampei TaxID=57062 RepID=A0ABD1F0D0_HYPHA
MPGKRLNSQAREFVAKLLKYFSDEKDNGGPLKPMTSVKERVADALGISLRTVTTIKSCSDRSQALCTSGKSRPRLKSKTEDLRDSQKQDVRNVIYDMYAQSK